MAANLSCTESEELLAMAALGVLTRAEGAPLDEHLRMCASCRGTAGDYLQAVAALPGALDAAEPPPSLRRNLLRAVFADAAPAAERPRHPRLRWTLPRRRLLPIAGAAVTAAAVIVAVVALLRPTGDETRTFSVVGSTSDPGVQGTLTDDATSHESVLTVTGLPQPATGAAAPQAYEVWLIRGDGSALGVAFLTQSPVDHSWSTVVHGPLSQYTEVAATAEPPGGSLQPTGPQLLSVQLTH